MALIQIYQPSGVPQGSVLGLLLFLMYINDLNVAIKHCKVHHFADDTNLLNINKSPKHLNKFINIDLKNLTKWLNANKISLNVSKTEMVLFRPKRKSMDFSLKILEKNFTSKINPDVILPVTLKFYQ